MGMKKVIPVIIAIALICIIVAVSFGKTLYEKYSYGQERADLNEYFEIFGADDAPIILQDEKIGRSAWVSDGAVYFEESFIKEYFTKRFYYDENEELLLYTTADTTYEAGADSKTVTDIQTGETSSYDSVIWKLRDNKLYIFADYIRHYVNFEYELFNDPYHLQVYTEWNQRVVATVKSDTQVRWRGGVKSEILTDASEGDKVTILEEMDDWTKVKTKDGFIGYIENKRLADETVETPSPVTTAIEDNFTYLTRDHRINLTWHNIEYPQGGSELLNALGSVRELNVISPTWYWLSDDLGGFEEVGNAGYVTKAHELGIEVWPSVSNFHYESDVSTYNVLGYTSIRRQFTRNLVENAVAYGVDGINVDFETMDSSTTPHFVQFVRELTLAAHKEGLVISVDNYVPTEYTAHYNRAEQGRFADYIIIMGYDEHYQGSEIGSVSTVSWMDSGIENTIKAVGDAKRVINAIPFYTRVWKTTDGTVESEAVTMKVQNDFIERNNLEPTWDNDTNQYYAEATISGTFYQVWLENADSVEVRLNVMKKYDLGGVASWCLGQETPDIWDVIASYMQ